MSAAPTGGRGGAVLSSNVAYVLDESTRSVARRDGGPGRESGRPALSGPPARPVDLRQERDRPGRDDRPAQGLPRRAGRDGERGRARGRAAHPVARRPPEARAPLPRRRSGAGGGESPRGSG